MTKAFLLTAALFALPAVSLAATYDYVNTNGQMQSVNADNADAARALAVNIAPNSGVMLDSGTMTQNSGTMTQNNTTTTQGSTTTTVVSNGTATTAASFPSGSYQYVDVNGNVKVIVAGSADAALALATDIAPHSGVLSIAAAGTAISTSTDIPL